MDDKTSYGISEALREYIDALVQEVILEGTPLENHKKFLRKFSEIEGLDYSNLEEQLIELIKVAEETKSHESKPKSTANNTFKGWSSEYVEQLRMAYCRKDMEFLEQAFFANSIIITGAEVPRKGIRYRTQKKQQYLENLRFIFNKNKTIEVTFESDDSTGVIYESPDGQYQMVRLIQHWVSDHYSDKGYLSMLLCANTTRPTILIRAWQPLIG